MVLQTLRSDGFLNFVIAVAMTDTSDPHAAYNAAQREQAMGCLSCLIQETSAMETVLAEESNVLTLFSHLRHSKTTPRTVESITAILYHITSADGYCNKLWVYPMDELMASVRDTNPANAAIEAYCQFIIHKHETWKYKNRRGKPPAPLPTPSVDSDGDGLSESGSNGSDLEAVPTRPPPDSGVSDAPYGSDGSPSDGGSDGSRDDSENVSSAQVSAMPAPQARPSSSKLRRKVTFRDEPKARPGSGNRRTFKKK